MLSFYTSQTRLIKQTLKIIIFDRSDKEVLLYTADITVIDVALIQAQKSVEYRSGTGLWKSHDICKTKRLLKLPSKPLWAFLLGEYD